MTAISRSYTETRRVDRLARRTSPSHMRRKLRPTMIPPTQQLELPTSPASATTDVRGLTTSTRALVRHWQPPPRHPTTPKPAELPPASALGEIIGPVTRLWLHLVSAPQNTAVTDSGAHGPAPTDDDGPTLVPRRSVRQSPSAGPNSGTRSACGTLGVAGSSWCIARQLPALAATGLGVGRSRMWELVAPSRLPAHRVGA